MPIDKQVLAFVSFVSNMETMRSVHIFAANFDIVRAY